MLRIAADAQLAHGRGQGGSDGDGGLVLDSLRSAGRDDGYDAARQRAVVQRHPESVANLVEPARFRPLAIVPFDEAGHIGGEGGIEIAIAAESVAGRIGDGMGAQLGDVARRDE